MGRTPRIHIPGAAFHITARTQGRAPWFGENIRGGIEEIILQGVTSSDASLLAQAVMPNHFHIILKQGTRPLGWVMHPVMRRIAILVQRSRGVEDHVFGAPFWAGDCSSGEYLRTSIIYTNLNPKRARLCLNDVAYPWSSHVHYLAGTTYDHCDLVAALQLFADQPGSSLTALRRQYALHAEWRLEKDRCDDVGEKCLVPQPMARYGDAYFAEHFVSRIVKPQPALPDLRDAAIVVLKKIDCGTDVSALRGRLAMRDDRRVRRQLIAALLQRGYGVRPIARLLCVSDSVPSEVATKMRYAMFK